MNLDDLVGAIRATLRTETEDYNPAAGLARLEAALRREDVPAPVSQPPLTLLRTATGNDPDARPLARLEAALRREDIPAPVTQPPSARPTGWVDDWTSLAACATSDPEEIFTQSAAQSRAKAVCSGCSVRTECLADALDNRIEFGVWGGMTERERRALLRRRPSVASWRRLLETARADYQESLGNGVAVSQTDGFGLVAGIPGSGTSG